MPPNDVRQIVAVTGLVRDHGGLVLMVRSPHRGWEIPGGQAERGETVVDALHREIEEETGIVVEIQRLGGVYQNLEAAILILAFVCRPTGGNVRTSEEGREVGWFSEQQAEGMIGRPTMRLRFQDLCTKRDGVVFRSYCPTTLAGLMSSINL